MVAVTEGLTYSVLTVCMLTLCFSHTITCESQEPQQHARSALSALSCAVLWFLHTPHSLAGHATSPPPPAESSDTQDGNGQLRCIQNRAAVCDRPPLRAAPHGAQRPGRPRRSVLL